MYKTLLATLTATALSTVAVEAAPAVRAEPLDAATLKTIKSQFGRLMEFMKLTNKLSDRPTTTISRLCMGCSGQSPSTLLVAK